MFKLLPNFKQVATDTSKSIAALDSRIVTDARNIYLLWYKRLGVDKKRVFLIRR